MRLKRRYFVMSKVLTKEYKVTKYKGKRFYLVENSLGFIPGYRFKCHGISIISINKDLSNRDKQLQLHRLLNGRGLRDVRSGKPVKPFN
jgi:hypothetical protein